MARQSVAESVRIIVSRTNPTVEPLICSVSKSKERPSRLCLDCSPSAISRSWILLKSIPSDRAITRAKTTEFADGFAQTVVFALVIALSDGMDFFNISQLDIVKVHSVR